MKRKSKGEVYVAQLYGRLHFRTIFLVGVQSFTLADSESDTQGLLHCKFIQKMFVKAARRAGMRVVLRRKVRDTR